MKLPRLAGLLGLASLLVVLPAVFSPPPPRNSVSAFRCASVRRPCRFIRNLNAPAKAICGLPAIGPGTTTTATTGCPAPGWKHPNPAYCGLPAIGVGTMAPTPGMTATGVRKLDFTVESITDTDTVVTDFTAGNGATMLSIYNTAVMNVNTTVIRNVYVNRTVIVNNNSHVAFNGGQGGIQARPTPQQETYMHEHHTPPVPAQVTASPCRP